jgi:hypothetical protein
MVFIGQYARAGFARSVYCVCIAVAFFLIGVAPVVGVVVAKLNALEIASVTGDIPRNVNFAIKASVAAAFLDAQRVALPEWRRKCSLNARHCRARQVAYGSSDLRPVNGPAENHLRRRARRFRRGGRWTVLGYPDTRIIRATRGPIFLNSAEPSCFEPMFSVAL